MFAKAVHLADGRAPSKNNQAQVHAVLVATLQSTTEALTKEAPEDFELEAESPDEPSRSGNE